MSSLVFYLVIFFGVGVFFLFFHLMLGKIVRPATKDLSSEKLTIYECGEPTVGSAWIQFDLRYYVVALLFVVFDVEVAFFFPWAVVFGDANKLARTDITTEERTQISNELLQTGIPPLPGKAPGVIDAATAHAWAVVSFLDLLVFFGVLMVGFAYLWRRGDIDWVRSTIAERTTGPPVALPVHKESGELVSSS